MRYYCILYVWDTASRGSISDAQSKFFTIDDEISTPIQLCRQIEASSGLTYYGGCRAKVIKKSKYNAVISNNMEDELTITVAATPHMALQNIWPKPNFTDQDWENHQAGGDFTKEWMNGVLESELYLIKKLDIEKKISKKEYAKRFGKVAAQIF